MIHELFYDPLRIAYDESRWIAPIGGHSDHVHVSFADPVSALAIIAQAQRMGLRASENPYVDGVDPHVHTKTSYHYRTFPGNYGGKQLGMALDVSGTPDKMAAFARWVKDTQIDGTAPTGVDTGSSGTVGAPVAASAATAGAGCLLTLAVQLATLAGAGAIGWWFL